MSAFTSAFVSTAKVMPQHWACTCLGLALYLSNQFAQCESSLYESCVVFQSIPLFVYTSWKWFVSSLQSQRLSCVPSRAGKISSRLTLNVDGPRQGFNQSFLLEETATQHSLTTRINDQAAFHQLLPFSVILFMHALLEAHFSEMSIVCESGHVFVCANVYVCLCHALSQQSIHPVWLTPPVSCCLQRLINDPFA